jgi:hypothetical protein
MHYLSVGAMFKNESQIMREWIEHYLFHGVDHFYLIDDNSSDDFLSILEPYLFRGLVTLFQHTQPWDYYLGRQKDMYNHFILPKLHETQWLVMIDLDEYLWSPMSIDLKEPLRQCMHIGQIQVKNNLFGSNGHIQQPKSVVQSFTKRSKTMNEGGIKYIVNTNFQFKELTIHHAFFQDPAYEKTHFLIIGAPYFCLNHYSSQSREYWEKNKCVRGDGDHWRVRTPADFNLVDLNDVEDLDLYEQNQSLFLCK